MQRESSCPRSCSRRTAKSPPTCCLRCESTWSNFEEDLMPKLILIKHAKPLVDPTQSAELWNLSDEGREQARMLAAQLAPYQPAVVVSSQEPKAIETAEIVARELKIPNESAPDLHEHDRRNVPHMRSGEFISHIELFFRRPDEVVLGQE